MFTEQNGYFIAFAFGKMRELFVLFFISLTVYQFGFKCDGTNVGRRRKSCNRGKEFLVFVVLAFVVGLTVVSCWQSVDEKVAPYTSQNIQDNGENLLFIEGDNVERTVVALQKWIKDNPCKRIEAMSTDSSLAYEHQAGWLVYYENRDNCLR